MPIPLPLLVRLVADPLINVSLINGLCGTGPNKTMPEKMPAFYLRPFRSLEYLFEMVVGFVFGQWPDGLLTSCLQRCRTSNVGGRPFFFFEISRR